MHKLKTLFSIRKQVAAGLLVAITFLGMLSGLAALLFGGEQQHYTAYGWEVEGKIRDALNFVWEKITGFFSSLVNSLEDMFSGLFSSIKSGLQTVVNALVSPFRYAASSMQQAWATLNSYVSRLGPFAPIVVFAVFAAVAIMGLMLFKRVSPLGKITG